MKTYETIIAVVVTGLACTAATSRADFVVNGGFEDHPDFSTGSPNGGTWGTFATITGWTSSGPGLEIGTGDTYAISGFVGNDVMELDSTGNVTASQVVLTSVASYSLSFLAAARGNLPSPLTDSTTTFNVLWNGVVVASIAPTSSTMQLYTITVDGLSGGSYNSLTFQGTGDSDSYGALIDDVEVNDLVIGGHGAVPETSTILAGALMLLPFGIGAIRSVRKDRNA